MSEPSLRWKYSCIWRINIWL